jgi:glutaredoxin-related protein
MRIAFFTEGGYQGKISRDNPNMRTDLAWICSLNADHWNINSSPNQQYDLGIIIIPKNNPQFDLNRLKQYCSKIAVMQEGPNWYWQDYSLPQQIWYFNTIQEADFMFVHNKSDQKYYEGLTGKKCKILSSLMIEDSINNLPQVERKDIIIGGNFCSWYGGFDSYIVAQEANCPIFIPSMGRKIEGEEQMENLNHLPYMNWVEWIKSLNNFKYGIHLMRTHAAGTFALNCAYLGIPCIGYEGLDTQEICHPDLTVKLGDLTTAKEKLNRLKTDKDFYDLCSEIAKFGYENNYQEKNFKI